MGLKVGYSLVALSWYFFFIYSCKRVFDHVLRQKVSQVFRFSLVGLGSSLEIPHKIKGFDALFIMSQKLGRSSDVSESSSHRSSLVEVQTCDSDKVAGGYLFRQPFKCAVGSLQEKAEDNHAGQAHDLKAK